MKNFMKKQINFTVITNIALTIAEVAALYTTQNTKILSIEDLGVETTGTLPEGYKFALKLEVSS